jgi:hypothetical protein
MARLEKYEKHIVCLESFWSKDLESKVSVEPILQLAASINDVKFIHMSCNTRGELYHNLNKMKRRRKYSILYFAFHGRPGEILMDESSVDLESLADFMGRWFSGRIIHFGSCSTIDVEERRIMDFMKATGVAMVIGHKRDVNWMEGSAVDLLIFNWIQYYRDMGRFWSHFRKRYKGLISLTGLKVYHK